MGGGRRQRTVDARIRAEDILKSQQREETPAHWQLAEWSIGADGMPDLVGAAPARFVEPQSQHGAHGGRMIERRPKRRKRLFELLLLDRLGIDPFRDPLLDGQHRPREGRIFSRTTLPSPIGQDQFAMVAHWPSASLEQAKGNGKTPVARQAAIDQQLAMSWADAAFSEHPAGPQITVTPCGLIVSEASKTDRG